MFGRAVPFLNPHITYPTTTPTLHAPLTPNAPVEIEPKGSVKLEEDIEEEAITGAQLRSAVVSKLDILEISNLRCVDLRDADYIGKSDPYVVLVLGRVGTSFEEKMAEAAMSAGGGMAKTHIMKNDLNPDYREWGCALELGSYLSHADLEVHVKVSGGVGLGSDRRRANIHPHTHAHKHAGL